LLLRVRRLLLHVLIAAAHSANESTGRGADRGAFTSVASDRSPDGADCGTATSTAKWAWSIGRGLSWRLRGIIAALLSGPAATRIAVLVLLRGALAFGWIDDHILRLAWHSHNNTSDYH
jgi:hypothetical protein